MQIDLRVVWFWSAPLGMMKDHLRSTLRSSSNAGGFYPHRAGSPADYET